MSKDSAFYVASQRSHKSPRYIVYDGEDFGADNVGQGGYQVCCESDLNGFYQGCAIVAAFENGQSVD